MKQKRKLENDLFYEKFNALSDEIKEDIILEPLFMVDGKRFRFDYISKSDYLTLERIINYIESSTIEQNDIITNLKEKAIEQKDTSSEIDTLKNVFLAEMNKLKDSLDSSLKITDKKLITVKDFEEIYSIGEETQRKLRGRFPKDDPLPCIQTAKRGTVLYDIKVVDQWMDNYRNNEG
jgi:hypothetical protein